MTVLKEGKRKGLGTSTLLEFIKNRTAISNSILSL
jgi:hypothetical protein